MFSKRWPGRPDRDAFLLCLDSKGCESSKSIPKDKYLGKWHEIARMDFKFEKGLDHVTANYSLKDNGLISVENKGYRSKKDKWVASIGKAKFVDHETRFGEAGVATDTVNCRLYTT